MILVVCKEKLDPSTEEVSDWIHYMGGSFLRLNGEDIYGEGKVTIEIGNNHESAVLPKRPDFDFPDFNVGWFRRWSDRSYIEAFQKGSISNATYSTLQSILFKDELDIREYITTKYKVKEWLTDPGRSGVNKLMVLAKAKVAGLVIPETILCSIRSDLEAFKERAGRIITKDISIPYQFYKKHIRIGSLTCEITDADIAGLPAFFKPSLFQQLIDKAYELRVFYLDGKFYSMAIFSQNDEQTKIDFRNYNTEKPNRKVPYKLPEEIESKTRSLMQSLKLNTGSIDFIKTTEGQYVFLEINPVGQFGMTSHPCNYYLEKEIANYLISHDK